LRRGQRRASRLRQRLLIQTKGFGNPRGRYKSCTIVATAPVLPVGYLSIASRSPDRRMILAGYRLADLLMLRTQN
jgi:hypothetical protein